MKNGFATDRYPVMQELLRQIDFVGGGVRLHDLRQIDFQTRRRIIIIYDKLIAQDIEVAHFAGPHLRQIDSL